jgi:hypothetical protein
MFTWITGLSTTEKILYGLGGLIALLILAGGVFVMIAAFSGGGSNVNSAADQTDADQQAEEQQAFQDSEDTLVMSPSPLVQKPIEAVQRAGGGGVVYLTVDGELRRLAPDRGERTDIAEVDIVNPAYVFIPPVPSPEFLVIKERGRYRTVQFGRERQINQLPSEIQFLDVNSINETIYGLINRNTAQAKIRAYNLDGGGEREVLARPGIERVEFAGNNLFYVANDTLYEYDLGDQKERKVLGQDAAERTTGNEDAEITFDVNGGLYQAVITQGNKTFLYQFADTPRKLRSLSITIDPRAVVWDESNSRLHYIQEERVFSLSLAEEKRAETDLKLNNASMDTETLHVDTSGRILFLDKEDRYLYRLISGM